VIKEEDKDTWKRSWLFSQESRFGQEYLRRELRK
jgi:hypothetical protein